MLQDLEAGKPLEVEALIGAILEMGRMTDTPTPVIESVYALIKLLDEGTQARSAAEVEEGCHQGGVAPGAFSRRPGLAARRDRRGDLDQLRS